MQRFNLTKCTGAGLAYSSISVCYVFIILSASIIPTKKNYVSTEEAEKKTETT